MALPSAWAHLKTVANAPAETENANSATSARSCARACMRRQDQLVALPQRFTANARATDLTTEPTHSSRSWDSPFTIFLQIGPVRAAPAIAAELARARMDRRDRPGAHAQSTLLGLAAEIQVVEVECEALIEA